MRLAKPAIDRLLKLLCEHGRLVRVADDLLFHREAIDRARELLVAQLRKEGQLESVKFKYLLDTSRKFAIPLLDYFDRTGVTRRVGLHALPENAAAGACMSAVMLNCPRGPSTLNGC